jgi:hypothetical protein
MSIFYEDALEAVHNLFNGDQAKDELISDLESLKDEIDLMLDGLE